MSAEAGTREALRLVDEAIFDLPIGNDVTYSRGYSAGIAAARESLREAISEALRGEPGTLDAETILFDTLYAESPPERHGQLCPVWTMRRYPAKAKPCDCWVEDQARRRARRLADALRAVPA